MSLTEKIASDLITAMKAKDKVALEAIRAAKTAFTLARTEKNGDTVLSAEEELKIIQKLVRQRRESAAIYREQNRPDLYEKEITESEVLEKYLPAKMSDEELLLIIKGIIARVGAKSQADMGKVMGVASKELAGKADGKEISAKVKQLLGSQLTATDRCRHVQAGAESVPFVYTKEGTKQIVLPGESNDKNIIIEKGLAPGTNIWLRTPDDPGKFNLAGLDLIPFIKEREKIR